MPTGEDDPEDILSSSLQTLYDFIPITHSAPGSTFRYPLKAPVAGPAPYLTNHVIELQTPDTQACNWDLHASSIWVAALYLADHIGDLELHRFHDREVIKVLELGAGAGLPSILIANVYPNVRVTASDYPDDNLIRTLSDNIGRNGAIDRARAVAYDWGTDISPLVRRGDGEVPINDGLFDVIIAADTLWNPSLHTRFINSLAMCLSQSPDSRVYLIAGFHTGRYTIQAFLRAIEVEGHGLDVESALERQVNGTQSRPWDVSRAENESEQERRRWIVWIVLRWGSAVWANDV
ncbi:hypothetical protein ID866_6943 [Astraeus odoratus]|nr:hypothetical protein ID866_6943 [Astraeus odoratus]